MKQIKLVALAVGLIAFVACSSGDKKSTDSTQSTEQTGKEGDKTKVTIDAKKGEAGFENEDVDIKVKTDDKDKK